MKVLVIEPYYGGSHKYFHENLCQCFRELGHEVLEIKMKARHWRWRLQGGHLFIAPQINELLKKSPIDFVWINSMIDVCSLKGLLLKPLPFITYFHEHQMSYPQQRNHRSAQDVLKDHVYPGIHLSQYLSSHLSLFSSEFNRNSFFNGLEVFLKSRPEKIDISPLEKANEVLSVPLVGEFNSSEPYEQRPKRILWNHRWDFDKNPSGFTSLILNLNRRGIEFDLELLGQYREGIFDQLKDDKIEINSFGGPAQREDYLEKLSKCRILPVTSYHDFFGISVREAILSGVIPILPRRMAYPECIPKDLHRELLYDSESELEEKCEELLAKGLSNDQQQLLWEYHRANNWEQFKTNLCAVIGQLNS